MVSIADIPTDKLSRSDKIALMEKLWGELSAEPDQSAPPAWHEEILAARADEWEKRGEIGEDWETAKETIRPRL